MRTCLSSVAWVALLAAGCSSSPSGPSDGGLPSTTSTSATSTSTSGSPGTASSTSATASSSSGTAVTSTGGATSSSSGSSGVSFSSGGSLSASSSSSSSGSTGTVSPDAGSSDGGPDNLCQQAPVGLVTLPADDAQHDDAGIEWWYWTGHLYTPDGGEYGFEEVFFRAFEFGEQAQLVNVALTDLGQQQFHYTSAVALGLPARVTDGFQLAVSGQWADGGDGHDRLHGQAGDAGFDLTLEATKAPVLQSADGYLAYPNGDWTYYYSREVMQVSGSVAVAGGTVPVTGRAWFDHQWGDLTQVVQDGWEWFGIELNDGRDLMLNFALVDGGPGPGDGTLASADCQTTLLGASDLSLSSPGTWKSPVTQCTYPMGWDLTVQGLHLTVTPDLDDQELSGSALPTYWEGSATVSGDASGKAYVELNGFCP